MDILTEKNLIIRIETQRSGRWKFAPQLSGDTLAVLLQRVADAQRRFRAAPLHHVANALEREVVVRSVFGTNTIEGGELDENETAAAIDLDPKQNQHVQQRRVLNIKLAYEHAQRTASYQDWHPSMAFIKTIHSQIADQLEDEDYRPACLRANDKTRPTQVGSQAHGGVYKPPQFGRDIELLLETLLIWNQNLAEAGVPALIRAPLFHLYFEWIHPFYNGNGRVGRVIEASILLADGFRYAPFAQANYYLDHIDIYFTLFNTCRKRQDNTPFVHFFLDGMLETIDRLHNRVNRMISFLLYRAHLQEQRTNKIINDRQHAIATAILNSQTPLSLKALRATPWYKAMYSKLTEKTQRRDIQKLKAIGLIQSTENGCFVPSIISQEDM